MTETGASTPTPAEDDERRLAYRLRSLETLGIQREVRAQALDASARAIRAACEEYRRTDQGNRPRIGIHPAFVHAGSEMTDRRTRDRAIVMNADADADSEGEETADAGEDAAEPTDEGIAAARDRLLLNRPPCARLVHRKSPALSVYLTAIYLAQTDEKAGATNLRHNTNARDGRSSWVRACALTGPSLRARRLSLTRALDRLSKVELVRLASTGDRFTGWQLLEEDASGRAYRLPSAEDNRLINLPPAFFWNGWHLVLKPTELNVLLAVLDLTRRLKYGKRDPAVVDRGVALPESVREIRYGISGETYMAIHELEEFGLLKIDDPMPNRRRGKIRPATPAQRANAEADDTTLEPKPYQLRLGELAPQEPAIDVVRRCLEDPTPPRLQEFYELRNTSFTGLRGPTGSP
jgi:hypothetical protein